MGNSLTTVESVSVPDAEVIETDVFVRSTTVERLDMGPILCGRTTNPEIDQPFRRRRRRRRQD